MIFNRHANLKYKFDNQKFWSEGFYVSTVGLSEATIQKYIREQEKSDLLSDKLSSKEYTDSFIGQEQTTRVAGGYDSGGRELFCSFRCRCGFDDHAESISFQ